MDTEILALLKDISAKLDILLERTEPKKQRPSPSFKMSTSYSPQSVDTATVGDWYTLQNWYKVAKPEFIDMATSTLDADDYKRAFVADAMDQGDDE